MSTTMQATGGPGEGAVVADLVQWAKDCPRWQQDALRRLCLHNLLDDNDLEELTALCKGVGVPIPIDLAHVKDRSADETCVSLKAIHSVNDVNALAPNERLTFERSGVTVLYGDNGSGKSGYARILKRACRARLPKGESLLPNVYKTATGSSSATIEYTINQTENRKSVWRLDQPPVATLSAINVFDSRAANVHVDDANDVAYTPFALGILTSLAKACVAIRERLTVERQALEKQTPAFLQNPGCSAGTRTGKLLASLTEAKEAQVRSLAALTPIEVARLNTLKADLSADPTKLSRQLQAQKVSLDRLISSLESATAAASDASLSKLKTAWGLYAVAREAATAASATLFSGEALPAIGSETWKLLWEAARSYSTTAAYPEERFPMTEAGARCVLCLQPLAPDAVLRLTSFEEFVQNESKRREAEAKAAYEQLLVSVGEAIQLESSIFGWIESLSGSLSETDLEEEIHSKLAELFGRLNEIRVRHAEEAFVPRPLPLLPLSRLRAFSDELERRALALGAEGGSEIRKALLAELAELTDRQWLAGVREDVIAEIGRRQEIARLDRCTKDTSTRRITEKSAAVVESLLTANLQGRFIEEVKHLGVTGLSIELRKEKATVGVPRFRVSLANKHEKAGGKVGEVLSEGEFRCIALAAFLAEAATTGGLSSIVFDDPMSSLDHMHREAVARRIARLAQDRQVIVFTHDLAFLFLLSEECRSTETHLGFRSISKGSEFSGYCNPDPPANAQPVSRVIEAMRNNLANKRVQFERGLQAQWMHSADLFYKELRTTWERAVAEAIAPVLSRLSNKVDTKNLFKLTVLTEEHCKVMRDAFGRCSKRMHSQAEVINSPAPRPDEIEHEIDIVAAWVDDIQRQQEALRASATISATADLSYPD